MDVIKQDFSWLGCKRSVYGYKTRYRKQWTFISNNELTKDILENFFS